MAAAHYNHNLRGAESDRDAAFVAEWCAGQDIPVIGAGDVAHEARARGLGVEETARQMRYEFLRGAADAMGCGRIATAHSADDNLETLLLHLVRGRGFMAWRVSRPGGEWWCAPCSPPPGRRLWPTWRPTA